MSDHRASAKESALALPDKPLLPAVPDAPAMQPLVKVAFTTAEQEAQARGRYTIIEPLIRFEADQRAVPPGQLQLDLGLLLPDGSPVATRTQMCFYLAHKHQLTHRTIWRWVDRFSKGGLIGLADSTRKDKDQSRFFERYPKAATLVGYLYLEERQSVRTAYEALQRDALLLGLEPKELPSYWTVYRYLTGNAFSEPLKLLAREGRRVYRERCSPYVSRGYTDVASNEIWVSDTMIHDVEVQNDYFFDAEFGAPIRLRLTAILDFRSRFVVGTSWAWEGSSRSITTALRHAVTRYGPAEVFYVDNGKDFKKIGRGAIPAYLRENPLASADWREQEMRALDECGVLARLGMAVQYCLPFHPQSKHIERFFRTLHGRLDKIFPTYTGGSPDRRPDFTTEAMRQHRRLLRMGMPGNSLHPPATQFIRMAIAWIEEIYHNKPHGGKGMNGRTPRQVFEEERNTRQKPVPAREVLALMLAERERRTVRECSIVRAKRRYIADDPRSAAVLHEMNCRDVFVAFDPLDLEKIAVLDLEGQLIAWARQETMVPQSADANETIALSMQQRRHLEKQTRQKVLGIGSEARANGALTEVEHLAARAGVAVGEVVTQRRPSLRPDNTAVAPLSAAALARQFRAAVAPISAAEGARRFRGEAV
jgi:transposase InsO family protein